MQNEKIQHNLIENLENQTNFLLSAALYKCGNLDEAQDLTQDTLLAALDYLSRGNKINDMRGWLLTVLNRKFYQKLRRKYQIATVTVGTFGEDFDMPDDKDCFEHIGQTDEAVQVRKAVAYLSGLHREVIIRYYMNGESVYAIANALNIPQGTVKSRLSAGREQIKKELSIMENYEKQSYEPIKMWVSNSGNMGIDGEPMSLVNDDLIVQNLLWLAYNEPVTETELAKAIGIPTAYVEPIVKKLVDGELMVRTGNKVYTDFMISTVEDKNKYIPAEKQFIEDNNDLFFKSLKPGLEKIRNSEYYARFNEHQRNALELYVMTECISTYDAFSEIYNAEQIFKDRPNGGKWIAFGNVFKPGETVGEIRKYSIAGRRWTRLENYFDSKEIMFYVYDLEGFPIKRYLFQENEELNVNNFYEKEDNILKLLYMVESGTNPERTGFNTELLKKIPWLVKCGIMRYESDGKPALDIPVMSIKEWQSFEEIMWEISNNFKNDIKEPLTEFLKDKKQEIPKHLTSVPLQKQYLWACDIFTMAAIRIALKQGIIKQEYDYDDNSAPNTRFPYSMIFIMDK
ncbi:MAG: sigma-70 family RNA polymerase sigma factor [Oscillospiraceae bacterium]|nr:sigma-70 family RNA polymerase sigma factor [Oscillospiraceae bacterium]